MIFYKYTCSNQTKNVSASKEMTDKLVKQDINLYNTFCEEEQDDEIFLFMVQDEVDKLVFDVIFKKSLNKVNMLDEFAQKFIKSLGKSFEIINRNEISINSLYNDLEQANQEEFVDNINSIKSRFDIDIAFHRCFNEYMISKKNFSKDEVLELCNKYVLNDEIKEEIERIQLENEKVVALEKALKFLENLKTKKQVIDYLYSKGFATQTVNYCIEKLNEYSYLNDENFAKQYVENYKHKKGRRLLEFELTTKGISLEIVKTVLNDFTTNEEFIYNIAEKYLKNKEKNKKNANKLVAHLFSKGFSLDEINPVIKKIFYDFGENNEDWN